MRGGRRVRGNTIVRMRIGFGCGTAGKSGRLEFDGVRAFLNFVRMMVVVGDHGLAAAGTED